MYDHSNFSGPLSRAIESDCYKEVTYQIAENVGGSKHWRIWQIDGQSPKFSPTNLRNIQYPIFILVHVILV